MKDQTSDAVKLFIGSSSESIDIAEAIEVNLHHICEVTSWKHAFAPSASYFSEVQRAAASSDFGVFVFGADDIIESRNKRQFTPRDNVIFEMGMFIGRLGPNRVFAIAEKGADIKVLSDYSGIRILSYNSNRTDANLSQALSAVCVEIKTEIRRLEKFEQHTFTKVQSLNEFGLEFVYPNMTAAEPDILKDLISDTGPIRLFFHIATKNIGLKGNLFDTIEARGSAGDVDVRILHASEKSPLFEARRLLALGKKPDQVHAAVRQVSEALRHLEDEVGSSVRRRSHDMPFIWRMYCFSNKCYIMPYFSERDATLVSPVLKFKKNANSMYSSFADWFDYTWERSAPQTVQLSELISPAAPSGAALILKRQNFSVFGIPKRDLARDMGSVRFYGLGGKKKATESFVDCALREGKEEATRANIELVSAPSTTYIRPDGTAFKVKIVGESIIPKYVMEKRDHSGDGLMKIDDDSYFLVVYEAKTEQELLPSSELAALLLIEDSVLSAFLGGKRLTVRDVLNLGGQLIEQGDVVLSAETVLIPHGTAQIIMRQLA